MQCVSAQRNSYDDEIHRFKMLLLYAVGCNSRPPAWQCLDLSTNLSLSAANSKCNLQYKRLSRTIFNKASLSSRTIAISQKLLLS